MTTVSNINSQNIASRTGEAIQTAARKVSDWTTAGKNWAVENRKALLIAAAVAGLVATIVGFALMASATSLYSMVETMGCTWETCSMITHVTVNSTFLKGLMLALSGALVTHTSKYALNRMEA